jgi:hypothetical protein
MRVRFTVIVQPPVYESPRETRRARNAPAAFVVLAALIAGGCGLQTAARRGPATVTVTEDFGSKPVASGAVSPSVGGTPALALSGRRLRIAGDSSGSVGSVARVAAAGARRWFLYLNGVAARPRSRVYSGEGVWWDLHTSDARPRAVVGSFPEPFVHGLGGKRLPTTVECGSGMANACRRVQDTLARLGVPVANQLLGAGSGQATLTVEVASWSQLRGQLVATLLAAGPRLSGVYARFSSPDGVLELLGTDGTRTAALVAPAGLIAAVAQGGGPPTWLVTGTNTAGVQLAAEAFNRARLAHHFALALAGGRALPVPR